MVSDSMNHCWHFHRSVYPRTFFLLTKYNGNNKIIILLYVAVLTVLQDSLILSTTYITYYNIHRAWINTIFYPTSVSPLPFLWLYFIQYFRGLPFIIIPSTLCYMLPTVHPFCLKQVSVITFIKLPYKW